MRCANSGEKATTRDLPRDQRRSAGATGQTRRSAPGSPPRAACRRGATYRADSPRQDVPPGRKSSSGPKTWTAPAGSVTVTSPRARPRRGRPGSQPMDEVVSATKACRPRCRPPARAESSRRQATPQPGETVDGRSVRCVPARHDATGLHHGKAVGEGKRLVQVVRHQHRCRARLLQPLAQRRQERARVGASSALKGSSSSSRAGSVAKARASATRLASPPESARALRSARCSTPKRSSQSGRAFRLLRGRPWKRRPAAALASTRTSKRSGSWKTTESAGAAPRHCRAVARLPADPDRAGIGLPQQRRDMQQGGLAGAVRVR